MAVMRSQHPLVWIKAAISAAQLVSFVANGGCRGLVDFSFGGLAATHTDTSGPSKH